MQFQPFENADAVPAVADYLAMMASDADAKTGLLGMQSTSAFLLWATAAKACGADLTRQCMVNELSQVTDLDRRWPARRGQPRWQRAAIVLPADDAVKGGTYEQIAPETRVSSTAPTRPLDHPRRARGASSSTRTGSRRRT